MTISPINGSNLSLTPTQDLQKCFPLVRLTNTLTGNIFSFLGLTDNQSLAEVSKSVRIHMVTQARGQQTALLKNFISLLIDQLDNDKYEKTVAALKAIEDSKPLSSADNLKLLKAALVNTRNAIAKILKDVDKDQLSVIAKLSASIRLPDHFNQFSDLVLIYKEIAEIQAKIEHPQQIHILIDNAGQLVCFGCLEDAFTTVIKLQCDTSLLKNRLCNLLLEIICEYLDQNDIQKPFEIAKLLPKDSIFLARAYAQIAKFHIKHKRVQEGLAIAESIQKEHRRFTCDIIIEALLAQKEEDKAVQLALSVPDGAQSLLLKPIIEHWISNGKFEQAVKIASGIENSSMLLNCIAKELIRKGYVDQAVGVLDKITTKGYLEKGCLNQEVGILNKMAINVEKENTLYSLVAAYLERKDIDKALEWAKKIQNSSMRDNALERIINAHLEISKDIDKARAIAQLVRDSSRRNSVFQMIQKNQ